MVIYSSSSSSLSIWLNPQEPALIISQETPSIVGRACGMFLPAIFRVPMCALAIPRTQRAPDRSQASPSRITYGVSHRNVMSSLVWPMPTSSWLFGMALHAALW
jgi:hypothetical protein